MADTSLLPKEGEPLILADGRTAEVAWCSGWTWPVGAPGPTRLYALVLDRGKVLTPEVRVIAGRDALGRRLWLAERRYEGTP